jgi:hypothetical protein
MKSYIDCDAVVKKIVDDFNMEIEVEGRPLQVKKIAIAAQDAKIGNKVLLRYSRICESTKLPLNPVAMKIISSV